MSFSRTDIERIIEIQRQNAVSLDDTRKAIGKLVQARRTRNNNQTFWEQAKDLWARFYENHVKMKSADVELPPDYPTHYDKTVLVYRKIKLIISNFDKEMMDDLDEAFVLENDFVRLKN